MGDYQSHLDYFENLYPGQGAQQYAKAIQTRGDLSDPAAAAAFMESRPDLFGGPPLVPGEPIYGGASPGSSAQGYESIRDWGKEQQIPVGYNPQIGQALLGAHGFDYGNIPGTSYQGGYHYVTDENALLQALGLIPQGATPQQQNIQSVEDYLLDILLNQGGYQAPSWEELMGPVYQPQMKDTLGFEEAMRRAGTELSPLWDVNLRKALESQSQDLMSRGFYGQLPADALMMGTTADVEAQRAHAIGQMANELVGRSEQEARELFALGLQQRGQDVQAALGMAELGQAGYQGNIQNMLGLYTGLGQREQDLWEREKWADELGIQDRLAKVQEGTLSLQEAQFLFDKDMKAIDNAIENTKLFGKVQPKDAGTLGVPAGTDTWQAMNAAEERRAWLEIERGKLAIQRSDLAARQASAEKEDLRTELAIWEAMGDKGYQGGLLSKYGVTPGQVFSGAYANIIADQAGATALTTQEEVKQGIKDLKTNFPGIKTYNEQSIGAVVEAMKLYGEDQPPDKRTLINLTKEVLGETTEGRPNYPYAKETDIQKIVDEIMATGEKGSLNWWEQIRDALWLSAGMSYGNLPSNR